MNLDEIEIGSDLFIDANIFIYHFTGVSEQCSRLINRCEKGDLTGMTSANVILEVLHRLMMVEAVKKNLVKPPNIVRKLNRNPEIVRGLHEYFTNTQKIIEMGIAIGPVTFEIVLKSQLIRAVYGLMVNDSLVVTSMNERGVKLLATSDAGFAIVDDISICSPEDVE